MQRSTDELEEFRRQWREEVKTKKHSDHLPTEITVNEADSKKHGESVEAAPSNSTAGLVEQVTEPESTVPPTEEETVETSSAMDYYVLAVDKERQGNLGKGKIAQKHIFVSHSITAIDTNMIGFQHLQIIERHSSWIEILITSTSNTIRRTLPHQ